MCGEKTMTSKSEEARTACGVAMPRPVLASSLFCLLTLLSLGAGCAHGSNTEIGREEARGDRYMTSARHDLARAEYARALRNDPENTRLIEKVNRSEQAYLDMVSVEVEKALNDGEPLLAMEAVASLRRAFPQASGSTQETISRLEEQGIASTQSAVRTAQQADDAERAYLLQRALVGRYPTERTRVSKLDVARARDAWVKTLQDRARDDEEQNLLASAALHWFKVHTLTDKEAHLLRARDDQKRAVEKHRYEVSLIAGMTDSAPLDDALARSLGEDHHLLLLPHLKPLLQQEGARREDHPIARTRGVHLLSEGSAASGSTIMVTLQNLRCDERIEKRAKYAASTPRDVLVQRCMTTFVAELFPTDGNRATRKVEELFVEEFAHDDAAREIEKSEKLQHDTKLVDRFYARGAALIPPLVEQDMEEAHTNLLERALTYPLARAELNARVLLYWLPPEHHAAPEQLARIRSAANFEDLVTLLNAR